MNTIRQDLEEIYQARSILRSLVVKNLIGRYKNSAMGFLWHFFTPIMMMFVYYIVFTTVRINPIPDFWIYLSSGLFPFSFMMNNLTGGSGCIVGNAGMVKKMYFPREIIVLSQVISTFIIMLIGYAIILIAVIISGHGFGVSLVLLPVIMFLMLVFVLGYTLMFSALTVYARDVQYFLSTISMALFFLTPMYCTLDSTSGILSLVMHINPLSYFIEAFHYSIYFGTFPDPMTTIMCVLLPTASLSIGVFIFRHLKGGFAERL